ncbi:MAG: 5'-methylthioadenosine/S-adenosylhomocysteine nucleosidase [Erysipelotrichaceae bacterium]|nr:5'-methylthioadenosine/S-adenosylhomocysteine nucleosidase [Erysipelotrichaceae bacterium]
MIVVLCAMKQERDALVALMDDVKTVKNRKIKVLDTELNNTFFVGKIKDKEVAVSKTGVGEVYATIATVLAIQKFKPELIINLGCAGSLNENVKIDDVVVADRVGEWRFDAIDWPRGFDSNYTSFPCDDKVIEIMKKIKTDTNIHFGGIVSANEFIYKKSQLNEIRKQFPEALCGEMEGSAIANTCFAFGVKCAVIRSISDVTLMDKNYHAYYFNLEKTCQTAAKIAEKIIRKY